MDEIEVKVLDIDKNAVIATLNSLSATKVFDGTMNTIYFTSDTLREGQSLRIRQKGETCIITYKQHKPDNDVKICDEHEIVVDDFEKARHLLTSLGYAEKTSDQRHRTSYRLHNALVEIDTHADIPPFLEIEAPSKDDILTIAQLLGFTANDLRPWSGTQVREFYTKKQ